MAGTLKIDDLQFRDKLNQLSSRIGDSGRVLRVEMKALLREIIMDTPPQGGKTSRVDDSSGIVRQVDDEVSARQQGENAVGRDLMSIFSVIPDKVHDIMKREEARTRVQDIVINLSGSRKFVVDKQFFGKSIEQMRAFHHSQRSKATGRTPRIRLHRLDGMGRNKSYRFLTVSQTMFKTYKREVVRQVGKQKGGWAVAANSIGLRVPNWIGRHARAENGYIFDQSADKQFPSITVGNTTAGAATNTGRIVAYAVKNRARIMARNLERMIKYGAGKNGDYGYAS